MLIVLVVAIFALNFSLISAEADVAERLYQKYFARVKTKKTVLMAQALEQYVRDYRAQPASLAALYSTPGYEYTRGFADNWQNYAVAPSLVDANWTFSRSVLFTTDLTDGSGAAAYLAKNQCGSNGYDTEADAWCGTVDSIWYRNETRDYFDEWIKGERGRIQQLSLKFVKYYNKNASYPVLDKNGVALATGSITTLADLANYSGTATACSGQFQYQGIPIDCSDMFNQWGNKIGYQLVSSTHIVLVSETTIKNATATPILVSVDRSE